MPDKKLLVVLTGAGISAESGLKTFRDAGGLWENHNVLDVASIEGWKRNPELVHRFYDERRKQAFSAIPNEGHRTLARLEKYFDVRIITQNVDDLHEKAGSTNVLHLHGDLFSARSSKNPLLTKFIGDAPLPYGESSGDGGVWRPNIVWFGESVPNMTPAMELVEKAGIFVVVGTSLQVYPAAGLLDYVRPGVPVWLADPNAHEIRVERRVQVLAKPAGQALPEIEQQLLTLFTIAHE